MIYASTLFADYTSARTAYSGLLLPEQAWKKYAFAIGRSLVVFPLLSALLLLGADMAVTLTGRISGFTLRHASTLAECMTYTSLPLYHMPVMPYYLVTFVALITPHTLGCGLAAGVHGDCRSSGGGACGHMGAGIGGISCAYGLSISCGGGGCHGPMEGRVGSAGWRDVYADESGRDPFMPMACACACWRLYNRIF